MIKTIYKYKTVKDDVEHEFCLTDGGFGIHYRSNHPYNPEIGDIIKEDYILALLEDIKRMEERIQDLEEVIEEYEKDDM